MGVTYRLSKLLKIDIEHCRKNQTKRQNKRSLSQVRRTHENPRQRVQDISTNTHTVTNQQNVQHTDQVKYNKRLTEPLQG